MPTGSTSVDGANAHLDELETYRRELTAYCYRMLGSGFEAEDAVQETMVRAWRNIDNFEGRSSLRSWLYRIATNVCLDMLQGPQRRARPMDLGPSSPADTSLPAGLPESTWIQPVLDARTLPEDGDPAELAESRETIRLAFVAALQHLPPKQRAVLILREVLRWQASEVAELLETSVASVNSALQRARAALDATDVDSLKPLQFDEEQQELLARYVDAFERYDITSLVKLLHEDATFTMPPFALWLEGPVEIGKWYLGQGIGCRGSRLVPTFGQRLSGVRELQARARRQRLGAVQPPHRGGVRRPDLGAAPLPVPRAVRRLRAPAPPRAVGRRPGPRARSAHGAPRWRCGAGSSSPRDAPRAGGAPGRPPCTRSGAVESTSITIGFGASRGYHSRADGADAQKSSAPHTQPASAAGRYTTFVDASWWGSDEFRVIGRSEWGRCS